MMAAKRVGSTQDRTSDRGRGTGTGRQSRRGEGGRRTGGSADCADLAVSGMCCQAPLAFCILRSFEPPLSLSLVQQCWGARPFKMQQVSPLTETRRNKYMYIQIYTFSWRMKDGQGGVDSARGGGVSYYYIKSGSGLGCCWCRSWPGFIRARHALHIGNKCSTAGKKKVWDWN